MARHLRFFVVSNRSPEACITLGLKVLYLPWISWEMCRQSSQKVLLLLTPSKFPSPCHTDGWEQIRGSPLVGYCMHTDFASATSGHDWQPVGVPDQFNPVNAKFSKARPKPVFLCFQSFRYSGSLGTTGAISPMILCGDSSFRAWVRNPCRTLTMPICMG